MKKTKSGSKEGKGGDALGAGLPTPPAPRIDGRIKELSDWRGEMLARIRMLIKQADPEVVEELKWRKPSNSMVGVPVWSHAGMICTGETYKNVVKLTFAKGASLKGPSGLFNSSLEGNTSLLLAKPAAELAEQLLAGHDLARAVAGSGGICAVQSLGTPEVAPRSSVLARLRRDLVAGHAGEQADQIARVTPLWQHVFNVLEILGTLKTCHHRACHPKNNRS
jgi:hypothetical protein